MVSVHGFSCGCVVSLFCIRDGKVIGIYNIKLRVSHQAERINCIERRGSKNVYATWVDNHGMFCLEFATQASFVKNIPWYLILTAHKHEVLVDAVEKWSRINIILEILQNKINQTFMINGHKEWNWRANALPLNRVIGKIKPVCVTTILCKLLLWVVSVPWWGYSLFLTKYVLQLQKKNILVNVLSALQ